jgi:hypothetical protein
LKSLPTITATIRLPANHRCGALHPDPKTGFHLTLQMVFLYKYYDLAYLALPGRNRLKIAGISPAQHRAIARG